MVIFKRRLLLVNWKLSAQGYNLSKILFEYGYPLQNEEKFCSTENIGCAIYPRAVKKIAKSYIEQVSGALPKTQKSLNSSMVWKSSGRND